MSHVLDWEELTDDQLKEFLEVNEVKTPSKFQRTLDVVDNLYRGLIKENVLMTDSVISLEKNYERDLRNLPTEILEFASNNLNYQ